MSTAQQGVDVYATGALSDLQAIGRALNPWWLRRNPWPAWLPRHPDADGPTAAIARAAGRWRRNTLRSRGGRLLLHGRRRAYWRGYYAEGAPGIGRVGTGWTRRRALADLTRAQEGR